MNTEGALKRYVCRLMTQDGREALLFTAFGQEPPYALPTGGPVIDPQTGALMMQMGGQQQSVSLSSAIDAIGGFQSIDWEEMESIDRAIESEAAGGT